MTTVVNVSRQDARLVLTIDRPERRNALNSDVIGALREALQRTKSDDTLRAVVLTGAGDEAFCAGADLGANAFEFDYATPTNAYSDLLRTARTLDVPLIARVNGACMAGGMGLLAMCDLAIAAPHAVFGCPRRRSACSRCRCCPCCRPRCRSAFSRSCASRATRSMPPGPARWASSTRWRPTSTARSSACCRAVLANSPTALRRGLYAMKAMRSMSFEEAIAFGEGQIGLLAMTQDAREGIAAFKDKRKPQWTGK
jgi:enoyl-CoA hydratase/carnithine racemase